ncbi:tetratricopeptide repeat protein [Lignipirellula cremea]|uniref:Tetratricopeptide repeat protein n=1 Tax=Lignipirellula cremea TaxID=2528010 RepID=A0A518DMA2_9BACT|nr:tetratricopeptide repeat protein [Lignipirellula cremea]QDU92967.1 Tetratricopeptide repeat protein [Lignipirellula cremea]
MNRRSRPQPPDRPTAVEPLPSVSPGEAIVRCLSPFATAVCLAVLLAIGWFAYAGALDGDFLFDDEKHLEHPELRFPTAFSWIRPRPRLVVDATLELNRALGGEAPFGYHLFNVGVHLATGVLLFLLVRRTLRSPVCRVTADRGTALAFACAAIWLAHPLATQAVTYVIQRSESLMAMFFLLFLYAVSQSEPALDATPSAGGRGRKVWWLIMAAVAFFLGLHSKAVMVAAFPVALLYDRIFLVDRTADLWRKRGALYGGMLVVGLVAAGWLAATLQGVPGMNVGLSGAAVSPGTYALTQTGVILHYVRLALVPWPLCFDYGWPAATLAQAWPSCLAVLALLLLTGLALWKVPPFGFLAATFFLILAPTSSLAPIKDLAVEHRMYLPLAALVCLAVLAADALWRKLFIVDGSVAADGPSRFLAAAPLAVLVLLVIGLGMLTRQRNEDYQSSISLWAATIRTAPQNGRAWHNLALALEKNGDDQAAVAVARKWLETCQADQRPTGECRLLLGELFTRQQRLVAAGQQLALAIEELEEAPPTPENQENLGFAHGSLGVLCDQEIQQQVALMQQTPNPDLVALEGFFQQKLEQAAGHYRQAIALRPGDPQTHAMLGQVLAHQQKPQEAIEQFRQAVALSSHSPAPHYDLAVLLEQVGEKEQAAVHFERARTLQAAAPR